MTSQFVPCNRPEVCGVRNHRAGTVARCHSLPKRREGTQSQPLTTTPSLANQSIDSAKAALNRVIQMDPVKLRGRLRGSGIMLGDAVYGDHRVLSLKYLDDSGDKRYLQIHYDEYGKIDESSLKDHPDFGNWFEYATGTKAMDPAVTEGSLEDRTDAVKERVYSGKEVDVELKRLGNTRRFLQLNTTRDQGGDLSADNLLTARIQTSDRKVVQGWHLSSPARFSFSDGVTRNGCHLKPVDPQGEDMSHSISVGEYDKLVELDDLANSLGHWTNVDPDGSMDYPERTDVTIENVLKAVDAGQ